jgi:hypothetical protein
MAMFIRLSQFETDQALQQAIENLFSEVGPPSTRAYEEMIQIWDFGLNPKPEGAPMSGLRQCQQGFTLRVPSITFALQCTEPDDLPALRACLFGAVLSKVDQYPKDKRKMFWRVKPETAQNNDFDTSITKYRGRFRIGMWIDNGPKQEGIVL